MTMKKTREEVAYEYLKEAGPAIIKYEKPGDGATQIMLSGNGEAFWLNKETGPEVPFITLKEVLEEAKELILQMFTADMDDSLDLTKVYAFENDLREFLKNSELSPEEKREIKIKYLDLKESILDK